MHLDRVLYGTDTLIHRITQMSQTQSATQLDLASVTPFVVYRSMVAEKAERLRSPSLVQVRRLPPRSTAPQP